MDASLFGNEHHVEFMHVYLMMMVKKFHLIDDEAC